MTAIPLADDAPVQGVAMARVFMPFAEGEWHFALGSTSVKEGLAIKVTDADGCTGFGYSGEIRHDGEALEVLEGATRFLGRRLLGTRPGQLPETLDVWDRALYGNRRAKAGLELALWDLLGKRMQRPVHDLLGPSAGSQDVDVVRIVPLGPPEAMAEASGSLVDEGYRFLKIKGSGSLQLDVDRLSAVRERVGADPGVVVDANQSMSPKEAVAYCRATEHLGIDILEQPVHRTDIAGLRFVRERVSPMVEADESVATREDVASLVRNGAVDAVSIKLPKMGGLVRSVEVARLCATAGLGYRIGASFGSRVYAAANMHFIACMPVSYACEVGEHEHLADDPFAGPDVEQGRLSLPSGPGLGVRLEATHDLRWEQIAAREPHDG